MNLNKLSENLEELENLITFLKRRYIKNPTRSSSFKFNDRIDKQLHFIENHIKKIKEVQLNDLIKIWETYFLPHVQHHSDIEYVLKPDLEFDVSEEVYLTIDEFFNHMDEAYDYYGYKMVIIKELIPLDSNMFKVKGWVLENGDDIF